MGKYDGLLSTIETIGVSNPIMDENGGLTIKPRHKATLPLDEAVIKASKERTSEYDKLFEHVGKMDGQAGATVNINLTSKAKKTFTEAIELMDENSIEYWTGDTNIRDACAKLRPILLKIVNRL
jgi:hypothetical protein